MAAGGELVGSCHCGRATVRLPRAPEQITECNCSLCSKTGFRGAYFTADELIIEGQFDSYVRTDLDQAYLVNQRCQTCGILTHWTLIDGPPNGRVGVNARLFDPALLENVPVKLVDGRSWDG